MFVDAKIDIHVCWTQKAGEILNKQSIVVAHNHLQFKWEKSLGIQKRGRGFNYAKGKYKAPYDNHKKIVTSHNCLLL